MCGILVSKKKYNDTMKHRGIKTYKEKIQNIFFVHEHLPIQSTLSNYPIIETDRYIILYNGEIFTEKYLNDLLYIKDKFSSYDKDPLEIIKEIFKEDGFFAFIIYDKKRKKIIAFTDPLGKKPLYYSKDTIGSEIRALKTNNTSLNKLYLSKIIKWGYTIDDSTAFNEIKRIIPNCIYIFNKDFSLFKIHREIYKFKPKYQENFYSILETSVLNRLKSNVDIGILFSGGLDSTIILNYILKNQKKDISVYCINNKEDLNYAYSFYPKLKIVDLHMDKNALKAMELPIDLGSLYPQFDLFKKTKETVILTGDGADEIFGGYNRIKSYDSQYSDIFEELPYYHNIRLDKLSMWWTKEVRSPFMNIKVIEHGLALSWNDRQNKKWLKNYFKAYLPKNIINRKKEPLKNDLIIKEKKIIYRKNLVDEWLKLLKI